MKEVTTTRIKLVDKDMLPIFIIDVLILIFEIALLFRNGLMVGILGISDIFLTIATTFIFVTCFDIERKERKR